MFWPMAGVSTSQHMTAEDWIEVTRIIDKPTLLVLVG